ncbi:uncharacterized protein GGS22DRAFT_132647 [Annulohypoxylon maeteangense]|uniref:uncharacterized protein n=1 Tax=Annulohypoxylon maeteangense TaxID=1927788 RepID=UPI0020078CC2|nr:uncharacterized protein GGS22DRAFT_132647 [Annulohypoxylon maeteangense]KAI0885689.1 hypothetical protein GGS22DRAFT_132647 [Annulohypoxylon maeteangense]
MVKKSSGSKSSKPPPRTSTSASKSAEGPASGATEQQSAAAILSPEEIKAQQKLLNIFNDTFREIFSDDEFDTTLQKVKQALFNRDFETAFGNEQFLEVYAARWSPGRALCYSRVMSQIRDELGPLILATSVADSDVPFEDEVEMGRFSPTVDLEEDERVSKSSDTLRMLAIGGGAAEIVAFGDYLRASSIVGDLTLLDTGPWAEVVQKLHIGLTTPPFLSKYASAAVKATNAALVEPATRLRSTFVQQDVLQLDSARLSKLLGQTPLLITMLFTLNELYTSGGIKLTTAFLRNLSTIIPAGSLLLVVDSPGSYSEAAVGKEAKKYPMQWLLDHTLLQADKLPPEGCEWEKLQSHDSVWFRLSDELRYPIDLQDMRYQMHLYRTTSRPSN